MFALCSLKENNTIVMFIDSSSTHKKNKKKQEYMTRMVTFGFHSKILKIIKKLKIIFLLGRLLNLTTAS